MNLLAHCWLSGPPSQALVGNLLADKMTPTEWNALPEGYKQGIALHHQIDAFSDSHEAMKTAIGLLRNIHGKYAPVVADVLFDHFLGKNWTIHHPESLVNYSESIYQFIESEKANLPPRALRFSEALISYRWLEGYAQREGMFQILTQMSRRAKFESRMNEAHLSIEPHYHTFEELAAVILEDLSFQFHFKP